MYQVTDMNDKKFGSFETMELAQTDAQRRANRYRKVYVIMWIDPNQGITMMEVSPKA